MKKHTMLVLVVCALLCGCQLVDMLSPWRPDDSGEPVAATRREQLQGTWHARRHWLRFDRDGSYAADEVNPGPRPCGECGAEGQFWFEDGLFLIKDRQSGQGCFWGEVGRYEVTVLHRGYLVFEGLEDECTGRKVILERSVWLWGQAED